MKTFRIWFSNMMMVDIQGNNVLDALRKYEGDSDMDNIAKIVDLSVLKE